MISGLIAATDAGRTVLAPNTELAAALFDAIERVHVDSGRSIWPTPQVRDLGGWLREQHIRRQLADSSTPRCMSPVEERELWRSVVLESESSRQFLEPSGAARAAQRARRAMYEYAIPTSAVAAHETEETLALLDWNRRFDERCRALHCISADQLLESFGAPPTSGPTAASIAWIESPLWRPVARGWLERNAGDPRKPAAAAPSRVAAPRFVQADSPAGELAAIALWAREHLQANPEFRAWVCIRDLPLRRAEAADAFDAMLAPRRFSLREAEERAPYALAGGTPLSGYPPVRAALDFLSASSRTVTFEKFSALLRAPELQATAAEASAAALLDVALRKQAPGEAPLGEWMALAERVALAKEPAPAAALRRLEAALRPLRALTGHHPMSRWLTVWIAALEAGPWALKARWSSTEFQSAERFRELLRTLAMGDQLFGSQSRESAESILRRAARDTAFQTQTGIPPIWVSGQLSDPWLAYDGLWVTGCDEAHWPPPADPLPLLPAALQRRHGVMAASADGQLEFAEDLQQRWLVRARSCVFSWAGTGLAETGRSDELGRADTGSAETGCAETGRGTGASPLLAAPGVSSLELAAGAAARPQPHWISELEGAPVLEQVTDEWAPPFGGSEQTRGVSTLRAQSRCAFRGFAETRLAAETLERPLPGFNERERGEMVHDALQRIWSELRDSSRLAELAARPDELKRLLERSVGAAIEKLCRRRDPGPRWRERERGRLQALLHRWLELEGKRTPFMVDHLEEGIEIARHAGLDFRVRVDRIDRLTDGARVLIDYKTGAANPDWRGERPDNPQLPVYALLHRDALAAVAYGRVNAARCCFVAEAARGGIFPGKGPTKLEGVDSFAELIDVWSRRIETLAREFAEGRAAVEPAAGACRSCHLHGLCRVPSTLDVSAALDGGAEAA